MIVKGDQNEAESGRGDRNEAQWWEGIGMSHDCPR